MKHLKQKPMNKKILEKVNAELVKETPDLSYIRGMVEVMLAMEEGQVNSKPMAHTPITNSPVVQNRLMTAEEIKAVQDRALKLNPSEQFFCLQDTSVYILLKIHHIF